MTEEENWKMREEREARQDRQFKEIQAIFTLAGIEVEKFFALENGYWPKMPSYFAIATPWYLAKTKLGLIKIGNRKRVIQIEWADTMIRKIITSDDVTKSETMVHAWNTDKAVEYLRALSHEATRDE